MEEDNKAAVVVVLGIVGVLAVGALVNVDTKDPLGKTYTVEAEDLGTKVLPVVETSKAGYRVTFESKLARLADGGLVAFGPLDDGGYTLLDSFPCKRKPKGSTKCTRVDGSDPGDWNTYGAVMLVGSECEPVPCSIGAGQKADPDSP